MSDPVLKQHDSDEIQYEFSKRLSLCFVIFLLLYEISVYIANDMIMPGMIEVVHSFKAHDSWVSASLTAYILGGATLQLFLGPLSDTIGRRPVMLGGVAFFFICTVFIAFSTSIEVFILARFFQGMGLCFIAVIGYATLQEVFTEIYAVRLVGLMNNITIIAPLIGPLLGALILMQYDWRVIFYIIAVLTLITWIGLWFSMPETVGVRKKDGSTLSSTSLHPKIVKDNYSTLLANKKFVSGSLAAGVMSVPIISWIGVSPLILIKTAHLSIMSYALYQIPVFLAAVAGNIAMRYSTYRVSLLKIVKMGSWIATLSLLAAPILGLFITPSYLTIIICISVYAFGLGFTSAPLTRLTLFSTLVPKGTASALMSITLMILNAIGIQVAGWLYTSYQDFSFTLFIALCGFIYLMFYRNFHLESERKQ